MTQRAYLDDQSMEKQILVIGAGRQLFWDYDVSPKANVVIHREVLKGIHAASSSAFDLIALDLHLARAKLASVLKTLREHSRGRLVLLSQMVEEPIALRYTNSKGGTPVYADDYLICPTSLAWLTGSDTHAPHSATTLPLELGTSLPGPAVEERLRRLERLATEDDLTGLKNRRYVWEFARQVLDLAAQQQARVTLLVYDIDNFKHYNDRYGHSVGDRILKEAAILMRRCCRSHDVVGRIGGDEFAVLFWDDPQDVVLGDSERRTTLVQHPREAVVIAQRFQASLKHSDLRGLGSEGEGVLTISGGLASYPGDGVRVEELFEKADQALLEAKRCGKNRVYIVGHPPV
jgi:GGDEF domain-containing protein